MNRISTPTCLIAEDEPLLGEALMAELRTAWPELQVLGVAPHGAAAVQQALVSRPTVLFLDIRMPGMSGLEAATVLAEDWPDDAGPLPLTVFVTAYDEYALQAFEAAAVDYVLKPVNPQRLGQTVHRLKSQLDQRTTTAPPDDAMEALQRLLTGYAPKPQPKLRHLQASVGDAVELVPVDELLYLEAADKYVRAVTAEKDFWVRTSLRELLPQLDADRFWQVHRSTVVNIDAVKQAQRLENGSVQLVLRQSSAKLAVSRLHANRFKAL